MKARQSIPAQIYHAARAANIPTTDETNDILLSLGESLAAASSSIPVIKISNLEILANIGVSYNPLQLNILKDIQETASVNVPACLTTLESHLATVATGPFLLGTSLSSLDCILFCASAPILTLVQTIRPYPKVGQWFNDMASSAWCSEIVGAKRALGTARIGGQIDLRPNPIDSYAAAMKSITINQGMKKKETQRQKEKKKKKKKDQQKDGGKKGKKSGKKSGGGGGGGESKTSSNPMDASEHTDSLPFLLGPRVEVEEGKEKRMATLCATM